MYNRTCLFVLYFSLPFLSFPSLCFLALPSLPVSVCSSLSLPHFLTPRVTPKHSWCFARVNINAVVRFHAMSRYYSGAIDTTAVVTPRAAVHQSQGRDSLYDRPTREPDHDPRRPHQLTFASGRSDNKIHPFFSPCIYRKRERERVLGLRGICVGNQREKTPQR